MKKQDYNATITTNESAKEVFKNISDISKWWTENIEGNSQNLNGVFTVRFGETFVTFKTIEVVPDKKIVWLVTDCNLHWLKDKKDWNNTKLNLELTTDNDVRQINFTHIGLVPCQYM